jgi:hypothetical protein
MYTEGPEDGEAFAEHTEDFLATYGVDEHEYDVAPHAVTWTPEIDRRGDASIPLPGEGELTGVNIAAEAEAFVAAWAPFLRTADLLFEVWDVTCSGSWCRVEFRQDYCGLELVSVSAEHNGGLRLEADSQTRGIRRLSSRVVPLVQIARNPVLTQSEVVASLVGRVLVFWCADGPHEAQITIDSGFEFEEAPVIFVQYLPEYVGVLVYRLAHRLRVFPGPDGFPSWTLLVDAIDGSLLDEQADFICD